MLVIFCCNVKEQRKKNKMHSYHHIFIFLNYMNVQEDTLFIMDTGKKWLGLLWIFSNIRKIIER